MRGIGRQAGVSATTVAHVLNDTAGAKIAPETRQKVLLIAQEVGYRQARMARSIRGRLRHLGVALNEGGLRGSGFASDLFSGVRHAAWERGYLPVAISAPGSAAWSDSEEAVNRLAELHASKLVDGFLLDKPSFSSASIARLHREGVPIVTVNGQPVDDGGQPVPSVAIDSLAGGRLAAEHLLALGHRRIALLTRPYLAFPIAHRPWSVSQLIRGYEEAFRAHAIEPDPAGLVREADATNKSAIYAAVDALFGVADHPTAIFAGDDAVAVMIVHALARRGLRVPADVSVIAYGDSASIAPLAEPNLTTVPTPARENGILASGLLTDLIERRTVPSPQISLSPHLVPGESTRALQH